MKSFLLKVLLFSAPVVVLFIFPFIIFLLGGEFLPISTVIERQKEDSSVLYLSRFTSATDRPLKLLGTESKNPEVVVIGTSRTLTFQSNFFKDSDVFYNAGYNADSTLHVSDLSAYVNNISPNSNLRVILLDMSSYLTNPSDNSQDNSVTYNPLALFLTTGWRDIYLDYLEGRFTLREFLSAVSSNHNIGLTAVLHQEGYRADGSLDRGTYAEIESTRANIPAGIANAVSLINSGQAASLGYAPSLSGANITGIEDFLALCKSRNIYVIGYLSPYALEIYHEMESLQDASGSAYRSVPSVLQPLFQKEGFNFYDMRDLSSIGSSDAELYDPEHSTEKATIRLLLFLAAKEPKLNADIDAAALKQKLAAEPF